MLRAPRVTAVAFWCALLLAVSRLARAQSVDFDGREIEVTNMTVDGNTTLAPADNATLNATNTYNTTVEGREERSDGLCCCDAAGEFYPCRRRKLMQKDDDAAAVGEGEEEEAPDAMPEDENATLLNGTYNATGGYAPAQGRELPGAYGAVNGIQQLAAYKP